MSVRVSSLCSIERNANHFYWYNRDVTRRATKPALAVRPSNYLHRLLFSAVYHEQVTTLTNPMGPRMEQRDTGRNSWTGGEAFYDLIEPFLRSLPQ